MAILLLTEYENQNRNRRYPFSDRATMLDASGNTLPSDFIIDAFLYPLDLVGCIYISSIDTANKGVSFSDSGTDAVLGTASYATGPGAVAVIESAGYGRQIGVVVFSDAAASMESGAVLSFAPDALPLTPTAFVGVNQTGVRGILLPDGTLVTGDVTLTGVDGVNITASKDSAGVNHLRIDVVGMLGADSEGHVPIRTVVVECGSTSIFSIGEYDQSTLSVALTGMGIPNGGSVSLDTLQAQAQVDFNAAANAGIQPCPTAGASKHEEPVVRLGAFPNYSVRSLTFNILTNGNRTFSIAAPSGVGYTNPIYVSPVVSTVASAKLDTTANGSAAEADAAMKAFMSPAASAGGILIAIQCLNPRKTLLAGF